MFIISYVRKLNEFFREIYLRFSHDLTHKLVFQGVKEIEETWSNLKFNIQKYVKGTSDRGYILGAVDDVLQILDDNAMLLQGMSASRFVGPFFNSVQMWEKSLSHISEVLDVSWYTS